MSQDLKELTEKIRKLAVVALAGATSQLDRDVREAVTRFSRHVGVSVKIRINGVVWRLFEDEAVQFDLPRGLQPGTEDNPAGAHDLAHERIVMALTERITQRLLANSETLLDKIVEGLMDDDGGEEDTPF